MSNIQQQQNNTVQPLKTLLQSQNIQGRIEAMLGRKADSYITSVLQVVNSNDMLKKASNESIIGAVYTACSLGLPLNNNLGFAYIVPFNTKKNGTYVTEAQFQLGYKGFIQLAQRSGQVKTIKVVKIYDLDTDEDVEKRLTSLLINKPNGNHVGFVGLLELLNGYRATHVMSNDELKAHAMKFSQTYRSAESKKQTYSVWHQNFDAMSEKTVIKALISKHAPLSIEIQKAIEFDQGVINENEEVNHIDNNVYDHEEQQARTVEDEIFPMFLNQIESGDLKKEDALNSEVYLLTDEQRKQVEQINEG
jgi:recombination protein RecT